MVRLAPKGLSTDAQLLPLREGAIGSRALSVCARDKSFWAPRCPPLQERGGVLPSRPIAF